MSKILKFQKSKQNAPRPSVSPFDEAEKEEIITLARAFNDQVILKESSTQNSQMIEAVVQIKPNSVQALFSIKKTKSKKGPYEYTVSISDCLAPKKLQKAAKIGQFVTFNFQEAINHIQRAANERNEAFNAETQTVQGDKPKGSHLTLVQ